MQLLRRTYNGHPCGVACAGSDATFDLSLLTSVLMPQEMVMEEDVAWE